MSIYAISWSKINPKSIPLGRCNHALHSHARALGRAASFCSEWSGYNLGGANDQGLTFFLPNASWMQPPAWVYAMSAATAQPLALNFTTSGACDVGLLLDATPTLVQNASIPNGGVSAQASDDGRWLVLRLVNDLPVPKNYTLDLRGGRRRRARAALVANATTISGFTGALGAGAVAPVGMPGFNDVGLNGVNTPAEPRRLTPAAPRPFDPASPVEVPPYSYSVVEVDLGV